MAEIEAMGIEEETIIIYLDSKSALKKNLKALIDICSFGIQLSPYEKRGNAENYSKGAKYDMAVGHLLLKSFWANEAVFQMMMLSYNLFLLFKFVSLEVSEYRQQIKTFRLKHVFLSEFSLRVNDCVALVRRVPCSQNN